MMWLVGIIAGSIAVWWLSSYLNDLTALARTDREAAIALFRSRVLPAFVLSVLAAVAGGVFLMRQGIQVVRAREFPTDGMYLVQDTARRRGRVARIIGWLLAITGFLLAAVPLAILAITLWLLRRV